MTDDVAPVDELQGEEQSPEDEDIERDYLPLNEDKHPNETIRDDECSLSQYNWDDDDVMMMTLGHHLGLMRSVPQTWGTAKGEVTW